MLLKISNKQKWAILGLFLPFFSQAQMLNDGIYMPKKSLCVGVMAMQDQFKNYWEGTTKRESLNMGTMTMKGMGIMATYGINDKLNIVTSLPYVQTKASAGVMSGMSGVQDLTAGLKYQVLKIKDLAVNTVVGGSIPATNYLAAYPLAIGNQSKTLFGRAMVHYLSEKGLTATAQGTYILRSNITIDATNYYTDRNVFSNEVAMANVSNLALRAGYYTYRIGFEAMIEKNTTLGGFDIRRNDMMFPANKMNATRVGIMAHYRIKPLKDLQIIANVAYTLEGRNVGQTTSVSFGLAKAFDFKKNEEEAVK